MARPQGRAQRVPKGHRAASSRRASGCRATVQRREGRLVLIDLGRATGIIPPEDQIEGERYFPGTRIKAILREVDMTNKGPEIRLSRSSPGLVAALFAQEIPEIASGVVEIKDIAREPGSRTKVAVSTNDDMIDPIGSCIGQRGTRIQTIIRELGGEKVDVVLWNINESEYITSALSPAKTLGIELKGNDRLAIVTVAPDQLSLAIGKGGQNVRLAAKLTGWKITVVNPEIGEVVADSELGELNVAKTDTTEIAVLTGELGEQVKVEEASTPTEATAEEVPKKTRKKKATKEESVEVETEEVEVAVAEPEVETQPETDEAVKAEPTEEVKEETAEEPKAE